MSVANIPVDEALYGTREVILFIIPFTLAAVNSNLFILPNLIKKTGSYSRFKNGIESIFLSLSITLFIIHCGILLAATGTEFNLLLLIPITVVIVLITTANTLPRFLLEYNEHPSQFYKSTNHMWNIVIRPFSLPLFIGGTFMLFCVFLPGNLMFVGFFLILSVTLLVSILRSYKAYQSQTYK
ncbi:hypothetical protein [Peribacillus frigoritolerans]|uniref:hypothetical protein n=1 Tax=Peribacillus frigoritolerans TaxID=450367 RepID=UPI00105A0665|nr:hypothetical protein [Peribacillus frigoritolerans]TDL77788.1 hypothetical protein E2R53_17935 [Peribacillus frigoritolerans]